MKKRADGRYQKGVTIRQPDGSKKVVVVYGKTQAEINRKLSALKERQTRGTTFMEVAEAWNEAREGEYSSNTMRTYFASYNRAVEEFGDYPIGEISAPMISAYIKRFASGHGERTVRTQLTVFKLILQYGIEIGEIQFNPAEAIRIPQNLGKRKVTSPPPEVIQAILDNVGVPFGFFPFLALHTGMRRGELLALEWKDFKDGSIHVDKTVFWRYNKAGVKSPKTEAGIRDVPILPAIEPYIKKRGLVFPSPRGDYMTENEYHLAFLHYLKQTGLSFTPHQLRHTFATMLFENDVSPKDAQAILGHASITTLMDIYTDVTEKRKKAVFDRLRTVRF